MIAPPLSPVSFCVLIAALIMGLTGGSCWDGVAVAGGAGLFELWLSQAADDGAGS